MNEYLNRWRFARLSADAQAAAILDAAPFPDAPSIFWLHHTHDAVSTVTHHFGGIKTVTVHNAADKRGVAVSFNPRRERAIPTPVKG